MAANTVIVHFLNGCWEKLCKILVILFLPFLFFSFDLSGLSVVCKPHSGVLGGALEVLKLVKIVAFAPGLGRNGFPLPTFSRINHSSRSREMDSWRNKPWNTSINLLWAIACVFYWDIIGI